MSIRSYQYIFEKLTERAGVRKLNFHALRHTFATRAIECGMDMPQISGNDSINSAVKGIDLAKVLEMVEKGAMGNLVEVETKDGDKVNIFVE